MYSLLQVYTVNIQQLASHISVSSLPPRLGGIADISHAAWVSQCLQSIWHKSSPDQDDIVAYVAPIVSRPSPADATRHSVSSASPSDALWDADSLNRMLADGFDFGWEGPPTSSSVDLSSPFPFLSQKPNAEPSGVRDVAASSVPSPPGGVILLSSPPPAKRRSVSASESIHGLDSGGMTIAELVSHIRGKGQRGLVKEYKLLKEENPGGTFEVSRYVILSHFFVKYFASCAIDVLNIRFNNIIIIVIELIRLGYKSQCFKVTLRLFVWVWVGRISSPFCTFRF